MSKLITRIKRLALALCLATPIVSWAATTYSTDYSVTGSETAYTSSAGNANVYWQNFNFRAAVDKDNLEHGYYFFLKDGDDDIGETDAAVKLDSITLTWGGNAGGGIGASDTPYLVVTTADDTPVIIGVSGAGDAFAANGASTFTFTDVVLASNAKYRFYFYKNDVSSLSVGTVLTGAQQARINGRWHNTQGDARADYNDIRCSGGTGYSINCSFVVSPLEEGDAVVLETGDASIPLAAADTPVVVEGKVVDGAVDVGSEVAVDGVLTVCGEATTLVLTDSLTATAFYFPATVTIDASAVSGLDPTGDDSSKTTTLLSGALEYTTAPTVVLPAATAGMIYETNVTASGISVTVVKGVDCVETITANTVWADIKPEGWIDSVVGDKPSIEISYEGEEPVTLTFDEAVTAGTLTLTGNIVVEASAAATFGTVTAGAGSVVEMANMTITTQSGAGTYRYRSGYPTGVPQNKVYEYIGGTSESPVVVSDAFDVYGYLKLSGFFRFADYAMSPVGTLDVLSGKVNVNCSGTYLKGVITIRDDAEFVNEKATDALGYGDSTTVNVYGTLTMGNTRWTVGNNNTINVYGGAITGAGEGSNGALDFIGSSVMNAYADSTVSAAIRFRNALTPVTVAQNVTLTLENIKQGFDAGGVTKKGAGTLKFTSNPALLGGITVEAGTLAFDTESDVDPVVTYTAAVLKDANMDYVSASNWKGRVVVSAVAAGTTSTQIALNKTGNANSYLTLNSVSGNAWCANDDYTVQPAITLAGDVNFENGYSGKTVTFRKIAAGSGNLSLKRWSSCTGITYGFTTLDADNYTGTIQLDGSVLTFNVGDILKANAQPGYRVLPLTVANNATVNLSGAKVNGEAADLELQEDGIYIAVPAPTTVEITIPTVENTTVTVVVGGDTIEPTTVGGNAYEVVSGSTVTITYAANDGYELSGTAVYTIENATEGSTITITDTTTAAYVATFNGTSYTSLSAAVSAWAAAGIQDAATKSVALTANVTEDVTIPVNANLAEIPLQLQGSATINGTVTIVDGATFAPYATVVLGGDVSVAGTLYRIGNATVSIGGDLTIADGATLAATTLDDVNPVYSVTGDVVVEGVLNISLTSTTLAGGTYKVVTGASVTRDEGADVVVFLNTAENDNWVLSSTPTELTITGAAATVDGEKFATFAEAVAAAGGVKTITLLASASYTLTVGETLVVEAGEYTMTVTPPAGYKLVETVVDAGVVAYTSQQYVARVQNPVPQTATYYDPVYYTSLAEAVENAESGALVTLLADDRVSFAAVQVTDKVPSNGSIVINKNLTINGAGFTVYGNTNAEILNATGAANPGYDMAADLVDGSNLLGFFVKSGNVTFTNITLTEFGDTAYLNKFGYTPIQTASAYTGTLTLTGVNFSKFNRTAVCVRGGTLSMTGGTIAGGAINKEGEPGNARYFQQPVEVRGGTATISGVTITGGDDLPGNGGGAIVAWSTTTVNNVNINFTGIGIWSDVAVVAITGEDTSIEATVNALFAEEAGTITVAAGDFTGSLAVDSDLNSSIVVSGGTFDRQVPAEFCADGKVPTTTPDASGKYTVVDYVPPSGIDPTDDTSTQEVTPTAAEIEEAGSAEDAAIAKAEVTIPDTVPTAVKEVVTDYKSYFELKATETGAQTGVYTVEIVDFKEEVVEAVNESAAEELMEAMESTTATTVAVEVPAGLYYVVETYDTLGGTLVDSEEGWSNGTTAPVDKPTSTESGFIKVTIKPAP